MAKLHFYYGVMSASKSTNLLMTDYNYRANGGRCLLITHALDNRVGTSGFIKSRLIKEPTPAKALTKINAEMLMLEFVSTYERFPSAVLVDEAQFFSKKDIYELTKIVDDFGVPVICYGLKVDSNGNLFEGSAALLAWSDDIREIKQICHCGNKATHILRFDKNGNVIKNGKQICIGAEDKYVSVCRQCWKNGNIKSVK